MLGFVFPEGRRARHYGRLGLPHQAFLQPYRHFGQQDTKPGQGSSVGFCCRLTAAGPKPCCSGAKHSELNTSRAA